MTHELYMDPPPDPPGARKGYLVIEDTDGCQTVLPAVMIYDGQGGFVITSREEEPES